jgi:hypothetical protein
MVYNFPRTSERYRKVARFVQQVLDEHARAGQTPIRWPDIDMAASVSGWTRFTPAEQWKKAHNIGHEQTKFASAKPEDAIPPDMLKLFTEFVEYQKQQQAAAEKRELFTAFLEYQKSQHKQIKLAAEQH